MTIPTALAAPRSLDLLKRDARNAARAVRAGCDPALGRALGRHVLDAGVIPDSAIIAGFWPLEGEIDIRPLLEALAPGYDLALPRTLPRGQALRFHRWHPGDALRIGRFGTVTADGPEVTPTVLLVPLLAFDRCGRRLGYGGGYYDRTLAALPGAFTIGCAFAAQEVAAVPTGSTDIPLHCIATERGLIRI